MIRSIALLMFFTSSCCFAFETTADDIQIDTKLGIYTLTGSATVKHQGKVFKADKIIVYKKNSDKIPSKIVATGHVSYGDGRNSIKSERCESNMVFVVFSHDVVIEGADFGRLEADKATYTISTKKIDLTSKKKVKLTLNKSVESRLSKKK